MGAFTEGVILQKQELNAIDNNFNQAVKKLHTLRQIPDFRLWLKANELTKHQIATQSKVIDERINFMAEKWCKDKKWQQHSWSNQIQ